MTDIPYKKGLHQIAEGTYGYFLPDGSWGLSNAGLVVDNDEALLIDTLFDKDLTREMLSEMAKTESAAQSIDALVITHGNGDHFYGSELLANAEIIASKACAEEMINSPPETLASLIERGSSLGAVGEFVSNKFGRFNFKGLKPLPATRTFEGRMDLMIGDKGIRLIEVGPAHTQGDVIVHIPENKIVFAGDILFIGGTPIMWVGPVSNWIDACDLMLDLNADFYVPGHGPVTDKKGVEDVRGYLEFVHAEALKRYDTGMSQEEAIADIDLGPYKAWGEQERIVVNVHTLYKEFSGDDSSSDTMSPFSKMAEFAMMK